MSGADSGRLEVEDVLHFDGRELRWAIADVETALRLIQPTDSSNADEK